MISISMLTDSRFIDPDFFGMTIVGQRRNLADLLRLQLYGFSWAATGIDQYIPPEYTPRQSDFDEDTTWYDFTPDQPFTQTDLAFDVLSAGINRIGNVPLLLVNEPIFISSGQNSDLRYNAWYPRWAYQFLPHHVDRLRRRKYRPLSRPVGHYRPIAVHRQSGTPHPRCFPPTGRTPRHPSE